MIQLLAMCTPYPAVQLNRQQHGPRDVTSTVVCWTQRCHQYCGVLDPEMSPVLWCVGLRDATSTVVCWTQRCHQYCGVLDSEMPPVLWCVGLTAMSVTSRVFTFLVENLAALIFLATGSRVLYMRVESIPALFSSCTREK